MLTESTRKKNVSKFMTFINMGVDKTVYETSALVGKYRGLVKCKGEKSILHNTAAGATREMFRNHSELRRTQQRMSAGARRAENRTLTSGRPNRLSGWIPGIAGYRDSST